MTPAKIKIGYAPTRRSIFSAPAAIEYRNLTADRLRELGVDFVDITDINKEGLLYDDNDLPAIVEKFKAEKVDGIFFPHGNFGTEYEVARLAKEMNLPVLLWGPRDECPDPETGVRLRDSQCGLFATGKVLRRFRVPFTYMTNCNPNLSGGSRTSLPSAISSAPSVIPASFRSRPVRLTSGARCATKVSCLRNSTSSFRQFR